MSLVLHRRRDRARQQVRERVPFSWRLALRRTPSLVHWAVSPPSTLQVEQALPVVVCQRSSPLRRDGTLYEASVQQAKEHNVARAAAALNGRVIPAGGVLSWHAHVGPPLRIRGFVDGPELHDGRMALGAGGGLCQVANLVYWLAVHGGLLVLERHRHDLDLFPDAERDVPFGLGATVFWPMRDLVLANPHSVPVQVVLGVRGGRLQGALHGAHALGARWGVREVQHRFVRRGGSVWRENRLIRWCESVAGAVIEEPLAEHSARVAYPVPEAQVEEA